MQKTFHILCAPPIQYYLSLQKETQLCLSPIIFCALSKFCTRTKVEVRDRFPCFTELEHVLFHNFRAKHNKNSQCKEPLCDEKITYPFWNGNIFDEKSTLSGWVEEVTDTHIIFEAACLPIIIHLCAFCRHNYGYTVDTV